MKSDVRFPTIVSWPTCGSGLRTLSARTDQTRVWLTFILGLGRGTLAPALPILYVLQPLGLCIVHELKGWVRLGQLRDVGNGGVVLGHGRASQTGTQILGACAHRGGVVRCLEYLAACFDQRDHSTGCRHRVENKTGQFDQTSPMLLRCHRLLSRPILAESRHRASLVRFRSTRWPDDTRLGLRRTARGDDALSVIEAQAKKWVLLPHVHHRMQAFGVPHADLPELFTAFLDAIRDGLLSPTPVLDSPSPQHLDQHLTRTFFAWASSPSTQTRFSAQRAVPQPTLAAIARLHRAADLSFPAEHFSLARSLRRRVVMHVGPTNSGKTHGALRALAAAQSGLYAGPLRLLAHEIWERLNRGQIVPLGVDPDSGAEPDTAINMDTIDETSDRPTLRKQGTSKYVRECNLRTGEEFRIVSDHAKLLACTVEMAPLDVPLDVAVVDEIQMIADPERGSAWTMAVLGIAAKELHLCGEEAAVPVIQKIIEHTGDELVVNRYERLTPLEVEGHSLDGDLSRIRKGDCLVTFSRNNIFALKQQIERSTGLLCAVAYGRLPPEIRSEQAALFNDPNSGYDVIVASDAIGMGLNL